MTVLTYELLLTLETSLFVHYKIQRTLTCNCIRSFSPTIDLLSYNQRARVDLVLYLLLVFF